MKISILQGAFFPVPPLLGGAVEKIWFRLGQEFAALGHEVTHVSRSHSGLPDVEEIGGVRHLRVRGYAQPSSLLQLKACDFLYSLRACRRVPIDSDIVVTNTFFGPLLLPPRLRRRAYMDVQRVPKGQMRWYGVAARLRACSKAIEVAIKAELPVRRHEQVVYIPNPLPFDPPTESGRGLKAERILYCGRVHPEKGIEILIAAGAEIGWPIDVVGPQASAQGGGGPGYVERLRRLAGECNSSVSFHPPVFDEAALNRVYNQAAIFVYPSIAERGEAAPVAPREAMAWGCVPVVSHLDCFKDVIQHEVNGLIFNHRAADPGRELAVALQRLIHDPSLRQRLSSQAVKVSHTLSPKQIAMLFVSDFETVLRRI